MHHIQKTILQSLTANPSLRYAKLKPAGIEGNQFMYHLKKLQLANLVHQLDDGPYELTRRGKVYVDQLSLKNFAPRVQPRIVTLIACQRADGKWLVLRRKRQPLIGQTGFIYGKVHLGEKIIEAASRELQEKAGIKASLEHRGDGYITIYEGDQPVSEIFFHMFYGTEPKGGLVVETAVGQNKWAEQSEFNQSHYMSSMLDLLRLLTSKQSERFFVELSYSS